MAIPLDSIPRFGTAEALELARREYGLRGDICALPSERDQNFLIHDEVRGKIVLKIANRDDSAELLDFQHQAMRRVAGAGVDYRVQEVVPRLKGADIGTVEDAAGTRHCFRALRWLEGAVLGERTVRSPALLASLGRCMAQVDSALRGFVHPAMDRVLQWDLRHADLAFDKLHLVPERWRRWAEGAFLEWQALDWPRLRAGVIHADANDHNVLVEGDRVCGLLDFGDMVHSALACDLAVALAYAVLHQPDPLSAAAHVIRGYHLESPLEEPEQHALMVLMRARLAMSLCYAAHNRARNPDDTYQVITQDAALELVDRLEQYPPGAALGMVREACAAPRAGREPRDRPPPRAL